jgi:hypothetical protein
MTKRGLGAELLDLRFRLEWLRWLDSSPCR